MAFGGNEGIKSVRSREDHFRDHESNRTVVAHIMQKRSSQSVFSIVRYALRSDWGIGGNFEHKITRVEDRVSKYESSRCRSTHYAKKFIAIRLFYLELSLSDGMREL